ncbi:ATP-dependent helicase HrpB [Shimia ponticola]|uniref:ATP-dependent helicase HrpB n=1 Tax=Shimia ponticola TaxID=2582893 RepID=UPI0011BF2382|nr:ATP-dependent helicase HrpB [Shimia ponticola]
MNSPALPIDPILPELCAALVTHGRAVLQAPPGAGKTTRVPLALLDHVPGKLIMLEPRRLAAKGAAARLAQTLGEKPGQTVGYRMRGDSVAGRRIEVVTEGILTRMLQSDPELRGISTLIFDEFHERSLNADLGLALAWEVRQALRDDLNILVMSATLDAGPVARMLDDAPIITSEGRTYPVDVTYNDRPRDKSQRLEPFVAGHITQMLDQTEGGILVFLPGEGEIKRTLSALPDQPGVSYHPLYGALPFADQQAAIQPTKQKRKVVLATSIAETSLTIEDVRVVIDAGLARRARFDPGSGMSRLVTERASRAEAEQRAGRAGRVAPGQALRLWTAGEQGARAAFAPAEIETADLTGLVLELAEWGADADDLAFLTQPPPGPLAEARDLLTRLGALQGGSLTDHGRRMARLPVHPRLAHMLLRAGPEAAALAALFSARDPVETRNTALSLRLEAIRDTGRFRKERAFPTRDGALRTIKDEAKRLRKMAGPASTLSDAESAALAYPDRIGARRKGTAPRYVLSGGKGAVLPDGDPSEAPFIVALDTDGDRREARIRLAAPIAEGSIRELFVDSVTQENICEWSKRDSRVLARSREMLGALALTDQTWSDPEPDAVARAMCDGIAEIGLCLDAKSRLFQARVLRARAVAPDLPDLSDEHLMATLIDWLPPFLAGITTATAWRQASKLAALKSLLDWSQSQRLDEIVPESFTTPLGRQIAIDYSGETPEIALRLQELFGQTTHPQVAGQPLLITLLSPAQRPVQTTADLPGFWSGSYADVRKDMRARYPKHPWPEDPTQADPTLRAKRRK